MALQYVHVMILLFGILYPRKTKLFDVGKIYVEYQEPVIMERHKSYFFKQTSVSFMLLETIVHTIHINQSEFWNMKKQRFWIMTLIRI